MIAKRWEPLHSKDGAPSVRAERVFPVRPGLEKHTVTIEPQHIKDRGDVLRGIYAEIIIYTIHRSKSKTYLTVRAGQLRSALFFMCVMAVEIPSVT